jgi:hypothetical protein
MNKIWYVAWVTKLGRLKAQEITENVAYFTQQWRMAKTFKSQKTLSEEANLEI